MPFLVLKCLNDGKLFAKLKEALFSRNNQYWINHESFNKFGKSQLLEITYTRFIVVLCETLLFYFTIAQMIKCVPPKNKRDNNMLSLINKTFRSSMVKPLFKKQQQQQQQQTPSRTLLHSF